MSYRRNRDEEDGKQKKRSRLRRLFSLKDDHGNWKILKIVALIVLLVCSLIFVLAGFRTIPSGYKGVSTQWGQVTGTTGEGLFWVIPFAQDIKRINIQIQLYETSDYQSTASSDLQEIKTKVAVNYRIQSGFVDEIWTDLRNEYEGRVIAPNILECLKASTAQFLATEIITKREGVKTSFFNLLSERLAPYHITVISVALTDFQFSEEFSASIEAKVTAEQRAQEAKNKLEQIRYEAEALIIQALAQKNATITTAEAEALSRVISAQAEADSLILQKTAEAEAIELVTAQLTEAYMNYLLLVQWDGKLPIYYGSDAPLPFLYIP